MSRPSKDSTRHSALRIAWIMPLALLVAFAGQRAGRWMIERRAADADSRHPDLGANRTTLAPGDDFPQVSLVDADGRTVSSTAFLGKNVVVFFFVEGCDPCERLVDELASFGDSFDEAEIVGITNQPYQAARAYAESHGIAFPVYSDAEYAFVDQYNLRLYPTVVAMSDGIISRIWEGGLDRFSVNEFFEPFAGI